MSDGLVSREKVPKNPQTNNQKQEICYQILKTDATEFADLKSRKPKGALQEEMVAKGHDTEADE